MTIEKLKAQLAMTEAEFEVAKAHVSRCDGAIQMLKHLLFEAEEEQKLEADTPPTPPDSE